MKGAGFSALEGLPAVAAASASAIIGVTTGDQVLSIFVPSLIGAGLSAYMRMRAKDLKRADLLIALVSALVVGVLFGPWLAGLMPNAADAVPPLCFFFAMAGAQLAESMTRARIDLAEFLPWVKKDSDKDRNGGGR